jgi:predicted ATPase
MRVISFSCEDLNSFISKEITFFEDVTFLHGINGSGKTTILRAIASLLTPDPIWLASATFRSLKVRIQHLEKEFQIEALIDQEALTIKISGAEQHEDTISIEQIRRLSDPEHDDPYSFVIETDATAKRVSTFTDKNRALAFIRSLPTPIFLGLDRTTLTSAGSVRSSRSRSRVMHSYFRTQLDDAIVEAERLVTTQLTSLTVERNKLFASLRNHLVLAPFSPPSQIDTDTNKIDDLTIQLEKIESSVISALEKINIHKKDIDERVRPFFVAAVSSAKSAAEGYRELEKLQRSGKQDAKSFTSIYMEKINPFTNIVPSISIIMHTLSNIEETNRTEKLLSRPIETYQAIMKSFFGDSGKTLILGENSIKVQLPSKNVSDLTSFSSGERQIFVLITHLFFNPAITGENVLLIDEPELSLHLKWQRQFVTAIRQSSPSTQMILATHSPEIVYNRNDRLISLDSL